MRKFLIKNSTSVVLELTKANTQMHKISTCVIEQLPMTAITCWHGHCHIGSFIISKRLNLIDFKSWGDFELKLIQNGNYTIFEIVEKF